MPESCNKRARCDALRRLSHARVEIAESHREAGRCGTVAVWLSKQLDVSRWLLDLLLQGDLEFGDGPHCLKGSVHVARVPKVHQPNGHREL